MTVLITMLAIKFLEIKSPKRQLWFKILLFKVPCSVGLLHRLIVFLLLLFKESFTLFLVRWLIALYPKS